jgi:CheY-like chemotaxis protein
MENVPRILIIAHDQNLRETLQNLLALEGCQLQFMEPSQPIFSVFEQISPDAILLDTGIPDSFKQCQALKAHPRWRSIPIILLIPSNNEEYWEHPLFRHIGNPCCADLSMK